MQDFQYLPYCCHQEQLLLLPPLFLLLLLLLRVVIVGEYSTGVIIAQVLDKRDDS